MSSLASTVRRDLSPFQQEKIGIIDDTDFSKVAKKVAHDHGFDERYVERGILALKQYYAIAVLDPLNMHAVSTEVDPFWHTHILFTEDYAEFCQKLVGTYVHHTPLDEDDSAEVERIKRLYAWTLQSFDEVFERDREFFPDNPDRYVCEHMNKIYAEQYSEHALFPVQ